jgi:arginyl-tRNA--protein-N-Asp/Glu arginylyltransferase
VTDQSFTFPKFYVTAPSPCPYLPGKVERKVFTELAGGNPPALHEALSQAGFRRSQSVAYRPACEGCSACVSVRVRVQDFRWTKAFRRNARRNSGLTATVLPPWATSEQFELLRRYLLARHPSGGMSDMSIVDYAEMVESSPVATELVEYRMSADDEDGSEDMLAAVSLLDILEDGISMVYSFYDPALMDRGLGTFLILDQIARAAMLAKPYVYLGYWVENSAKMGYKSRFRPLERLTPTGWELLK